MLKSILLFLISSFLHNIYCTVYIVTPDNDDHLYPDILCHHCHNLQHYLLNVTKYFTSNTQLVFLPGLHHLHADLIIENVHNISIIGSTANDTTPDSIIQHLANDGITIINSTMVTIKIFVFTNYGDYYYWATFKILRCYCIQMHNMVGIKILGRSVMGESSLSNITGSNGLDVTYDDDVIAEAVTHKLEIYNHSVNKRSSPSIIIKITRTQYGVSIIISDSIFSRLCDKLIVVINGTSTAYANMILFNRVHFINNDCIIDYLLYIQLDLHIYSSNQSAIKRDKVIFDGCSFTDNANINEVVHCVWFHEVSNIITIQNCLFTNNTVCTSILSFISHATIRLITTRHGNVINIVNTDFISNRCEDDKQDVTALVKSDITLFLSGPILIHGNIFKSIFKINNNSESYMLFKGYFEFSLNKATYMIQDHEIILMNHVVMNVTKNVISYLFVSYKLPNLYDHIPLCYFQFYGSHKCKINKTFRIIIEHTNLISRIFNQDAENINCEMMQNSLFYKHNPLQVYQQLFDLKNEVKQFLFPFDTGILCYCIDEMQKCNINQLGPIYPAWTSISC